MAVKRRSKAPPKKKVAKKKKSFQALTDRIKPVQEMSTKVSALFYGRSGSGKTTVSSTFPGPILLLDVRDEGTDSVVDVEGLDVLEVESWEDFEMVYWFLHGGDHQYKTVIIDTVTQLQDFCVMKHLEQAQKEKGDKVTQGMWGDISSLMKNWILNYRDLSLNVVFIAQDRERSSDGEDREQIDPEVGPWVIPSVSKALCAAVKVIGYTYIKSELSVNPKTKKKGRKIHYMLRLGPNPIYITKIRQPKSSVAPDSISDPHFDTIQSVIRGTFSSGEDSAKKTPIKKRVKIKSKTKK